MRHTPRILRYLWLAGAVIAATTAWADTAQFSTIDEAIARGDLADVQWQLSEHPERANKGKHPKLSPLNQSILRKQDEIALVRLRAGVVVCRAGSGVRTLGDLWGVRDLV